MECNRITCGYDSLLLFSYDADRISLSAKFITQVRIIPVFVFI